MRWSSGSSRRATPSTASPPGSARWPTCGSIRRRRPRSSWASCGRTRPPSGARSPARRRERCCCSGRTSWRSGYSGVRPLIVDRMVEMLNRELIPSVPEQGSLGASGDLAPLANLALPLIGQGELLLGGRQRAGGRGARAWPGLVADRAGGEGGARARQRDAGHARGRDPRRAPRRRPRARGRRRRGDVRRGGARHRRRVRRTAAAAAAARRTGRVGVEPPSAARGLADPVVASREPAPGAGRVFAPVRAAGARRDARRARLRRGRAADRGRRRLGQPDRAARRRRGALGRELPRPAGRGRARRARARHGGAGEHQRAPPLPAAGSEAEQRPARRS